MRLCNLCILVSLSMSALAWGNEIVPIKDQNQARDICIALQNEPSGNDVLEKKSREQKLKKTDFLIELQRKDFTISHFKANQGQVIISTEHPFRAFQGNLVLFDSGRDQLELDLIPNQVENLRNKIHSQGVTLAIMFRAAEAEKYPCTYYKTSNQIFSIDLMGAEIRYQGKVLAQTNKDGLASIPSSSGTPTVDIRLTALRPEKAGIEVSLNNSSTAYTLPKSNHLLSCYQKVLRRNPTLQGSLVLSRQNRETIIAETLGDTRLMACTKKALKKLAIPPNKMIVIDFTRK